MNKSSQTVLLTFYSKLSRVITLQDKYFVKVLTMILVGNMIAFGLISVLLVIFSSWTANNYLIFLLIVVISLIIGTLFIALSLYKLLQPVFLTAHSLHDYVINKNMPKLPGIFTDEIGQLMTDSQYIVEKMDLLLRAQEEECNIDPLTGILNRRAGEARLRQDLARALREDTRMLIAIIDIDKFEHINQQFGRHMGDVCLSHIVEVISKNIREGDWLARWGEDEFLMVLWNFQHGIPIEVLERIQQYSIKTPMNELLQISLSIGACEYQQETTIEQLLARLEKSLKTVKVKGQGGIEIT